MPVERPTGLAWPASGLGEMEGGGLAKLIERDARRERTARRAEVEFHGAVSDDTLQEAASRLHLLGKQRRALRLHRLAPRPVVEELAEFMHTHQRTLERLGIAVHPR